MDPNGVARNGYAMVRKRGDSSLGLTHVLVVCQRLWATRLRHAATCKSLAYLSVYSYEVRRASVSKGERLINRR